MRAPGAFKGRELPRLVFPIDEGVGYADDPVDGHSYTNRSSELLSEARRDAGGDALRKLSAGQQLGALRPAVARAATNRQVDPHNIAFSKQG